MARARTAAAREAGGSAPNAPVVTTAPSLVLLRGIGKTFPNGTVALQSMNMELRRGDFLSLLGPSGCGKSTALRILAGLAQPTSGRLDWPDGRPDRGDISFVFQEPTLMPWATVFDNVWLPLRLKGVSRGAASRDIGEALERVHLTGFEQSYPRELSGGMKMRVSIARALVTKPKLLLMDEPFAALDEITRFKLNNDILELWKAYGWTVVFVTHSVFESVFLSNRVVVMAAKPGRVFEELEIGASHPRDQAFRTSVAYAELCRNASESLERAMAAGGSSEDA